MRRPADPRPRHRELGKADLLGFGSPLSPSYLLDAVVPALAQAADGDPGTVVQPPVG
jgi:hypothetical protein